MNLLLSGVVGESVDFLLVTIVGLLGMTCLDDIFVSVAVKISKLFFTGSSVAGLRNIGKGERPSR